MSFQIGLHRGIIGKYPRCAYWIGGRWIIRGRTWMIYGIGHKIGFKYPIERNTP